MKFDGKKVRYACASALLVLAGLLGSVQAIAQTDAPASAAVAAVAAVSIANPYGLEALWASSDLVTKVVLLLLVIMSMGSWYIMIVKVLEQSKMGRQGKDAQAFWSAKTVAEGTKALSEDYGSRWSVFEY